MTIDEMRAASTALAALDWAASVRHAQGRKLHGACEGVAIGHMRMPGPWAAAVALDAVEQAARDVLRGVGVEGVDNA